MSFDKRLKAFKDFLDCLLKFRLAGVACFYGLVYAEKVFVCEHIFILLNRFSSLNRQRKPNIFCQKHNTRATLNLQVTKRKKFIFFKKEFLSELYRNCPEHPQIADFFQNGEIFGEKNARKGLLILLEISNFTS